MEDLEGMVEGWIIGLPRGSLLQRKLEAGAMRAKEDEHYLNMQGKLKYAKALFEKEVKELEQRNPSLRLQSRS